MATRPQIAMIHTLKSKVGMDDDDYRAALSGFGVSSSKDLNVANAKAFIEALMGMIKTGVFKPRSAADTPTLPKQANDSDMATFAQQAKIRHLWNQVSRADEADRARALNRFLETRFKIAFLNWLPRDMVGKVIHTLNIMIKQKEAV